MTIVEPMAARLKVYAWTHGMSPALAAVHLITLGLEEVAKSVAPEPGFEPVYFFKHWDDTLGKEVYSARPAIEAQIRAMQCTPIAESGRLVPTNAIDDDGFVEHDRLADLGIRALTPEERAGD